VGTGDAVALLDSLLAAAGMAAGPPAVWPSGQYLAEASSFPNVVEYFEGSLAALQPMESLVLARLRARTLDGMGSGGMAAADAEALLDRSGRWSIPLETALSEAVTTMAQGSSSALDLHHYLASVEDRIRYDPFDQQGVPVDPVVEAIPLDEEVEGEMWARIGTVADEFRASQLLRNGLQAQIEDIAASIRASGT
jgi:hypothetical protein